MDGRNTGEGLTAGDREQLEDAARRRVARRLVLSQGLYYLALVVIGLAIGLAVARRQHLSGGGLAVLIAVDAGAVIVLGGLLAFQYWWTRRHGKVPLVFGADRQTRREARRALRAGRSDDARIDDLISDQRTRWRKRGPVAAVASVVLIGAGIAFALTGNTHHLRVQGWFIVALGALAGLNLAYIGVRLRNYRDRHTAS